MTTENKNNTPSTTTAATTPKAELSTLSVPQEGAFTPAAFDHAQRTAKMLAGSSMIPQAYQGRIDNCMIALEMAYRQGSSPLMVMQNLHIIQGKPSWSSTFIIAAINSSGRFSSKLKFRKSGQGDEYGYEAYAVEKDSGEELVGPKVTWKMVKEEGWLSKSGSKWKTMPELMFQYRSAAFFGRLHTPEIMMGMQSQEEVIDVVAVTEQPKTDKVAERILALIKSAESVDQLKAIEQHVKPEQRDWYDEKMNELTVKK